VSWAEVRRRNAEVLGPALAEAVARSERLFAAGRLRDPDSRRELALLRRQLAALQQEAMFRHGLEAAAVRFLWRRAELARGEAGGVSSRARWLRARSAALRRHRLHVMS
jgi:hypothetical protein